jgi:hypothetical protein
MEPTIKNQLDWNHQGTDAIDYLEVPSSHNSTPRSRGYEKVYKSNRQDLGNWKSTKRLKGKGK